MTGNGNAGDGTSTGNGKIVVDANAIKAAAANPLRKRFYQAVTVAEAPGDTAGAAPMFRVLLDGRSIRTPAKRELKVPTRALAEALAAEWDAQTAVIDPRTMPLTRLVNSALDGVAGREAEVRGDIVKFLGSDLVCYFAPGPEKLVERQRREWGQVHDWLDKAHGIRLTHVEGIMPAAQPTDALARFAAAIEPFNGIALAALHVMTTLTGSAAIALACASGPLSPEESWRLAHLDEDFEIEAWGADAEATERRAARWSEMRAAALALGRA